MTIQNFFNPFRRTMMKTTYRLTLVASLALASAAAVENADAATIYQFATTVSTSGNYDASKVTTSAAANVIAPSDGTEIVAGGEGLVRFWNAGWNGFSLSANNGTTLDNTTEFATGYWELTVSAAAGFKLDLDSLSFASARGGSSGTRGYALYAEVDGGTFTLADTPIDSIADETGTRSSPRARNLDLTGAAYQGIDSVTFRYYALTTDNGRTIDFSGWTLEGDVVPEPGSLALLAAGGLCLFKRRRRS